MAQYHLDEDEIVTDAPDEGADDAMASDSSAPDDAEDSPTGDGEEDLTDDDAAPDAEDGQPTTDEEPDAEAGAPDESSPPEKPEVQPEPLEIRVHGRSHRFESAIRIPGHGMLIPEGPDMQRAQQMMTRGVEFEVYGRPRIRELESQVAEATQEKSEAETHAGEIINWFNQVMESDPETRYAVVEQWAQHRPLFDARVESAKLAVEKRRFERAQRANDPSPEEVNAQLEQQAVTMGGEILGEVGEKLGLKADDAQAIHQRLMRRPSVYLKEVQTRDGQRKRVFDDDEFIKDVAAEAHYIQNQRRQVSTTEQAAKRNATQRAGTLPSAVRAPATKVTPTTRTRDGETGQFKSAAEWEASMTRRTKM